LVLDAAGAPVRAIGASFDISTRKNDEARLNCLLDLQRLVSTVSQTFLDAEGGDGGQRVARALAAIGAHLGAQRAYLYAVESGAAANTHEWCAAGVESRRQERAHVPRNWFDAYFGPLTSAVVIHRAPASGPAASLLSPAGDNAIVAVPMLLEGQMQGVLCLDGPVIAPLHFEEFSNVLQIIAGAMTAGLRRLSDEDALHKLNERISARSERNRALLSLSNDLARATSRGALLAELRRSLHTVLRHEHVSFLELDPSNGRYRLWAIDEAPAGSDGRNSLAPLKAPGSGLSALELEGTAMGYALATSKPVSTREHERNAFTDWVAAHNRTGDKNYIVIPMIGAIGTFGTLNVSGSESAVPTVEQIEWAAQCAAIASAHLSKQAAQEQLLLANAQLAARVESRTRELGASDDRFQRLFQYAPQAMLIVSEAGAVVQSNRAAQRLFGYEETSLIGVAYRQLAPDSDWSAPGAYAAEVVTASGVRRDSTEFIAEIGLVQLQLNDEPHTLVGLSDVSERVAAQRAVNQSLREKETLLMEIHHRVKNNLQIISSLLMLQSQQMPSEEAKAMLEESVFRVRSMALIHQQLYGAESLERVDLGSYARTLAESVRSTFAPNARIHVSATLAEVTVDFAVPLGLILNELLTNAFKYGVSQAEAASTKPAEGADWDVLIEVNAQDDAVQIAVIDHGPGLPPGFDPATSNTLGLQLVRSLTRQLRGKFSVTRSRFQVVCPLARTP
jgi:PAS domain S-box-containing protein